MPLKDRPSSNVVHVRSALLGAALCLAALLQPAAGQEAAGTNFYFVQITDTHFGQKEHQNRTKLAVEAINKLPMKIECVVHTGDIMAENLDREWAARDGLALLGELKVPVHYVPGNHDLPPKKHDRLLPVYTNKFGSLISQEEYHGVLFLFVYTEPLAKEFVVSGFEPLKELETRFKESGGKPVIIFHHTPSVADFYKNRMHPGWKKEIRDQWVALLNRHNVKGVIAGHFHRDEFHWLGKVPLYVSSPIASYWGRQATYRIYEYSNGRISYRTQYLP